MESVINPSDNPKLNLKLKYDKQIHIFLDNNMFYDLKLYVSENKGVYNSVSHYIRCAIIQKLKPNDRERQAFLEGYAVAINDLQKQHKKRINR